MRKLTTILAIALLVTSCGSNANNELVSADTATVSADTLMVDSITVDTVNLEK
jgi:uncharacterized protein YcfL